MARLSIGVDVHGIKELGLLKDQMVAVERASVKLDASLSGIGKGTGTATVKKNVDELIASFDKLGQLGDKSLEGLSRTLADTSKTMAAMNKAGAGASWRADMEARSRAMDALDSANQSYINKLATLRAMESEGGKAVAAYTREIDKQISSLSRLQAMNVKTIAGSDYTKQLSALEANAALGKKFEEWQRKADAWSQKGRDRLGLGDEEAANRLYEQRLRLQQGLEETERRIAEHASKGRDRLGLGDEEAANRLYEQRLRLRQGLEETERRLAEYATKGKDRLGLGNEEAANKLYEKRLRLQQGLEETNRALAESQRSIGTGSLMSQITQEAALYDQVTGKVKQNLEEMARYEKDASGKMRLVNANEITAALDRMGQEAIQTTAQVRALDVALDQTLNRMDVGTKNNYFAAGRSRLEVGSSADTQRSANYAKLLADEKVLYDSDGKLKAGINNLHDYSRAMQYAAEDTEKFSTRTQKAAADIELFDKKSRNLHDTLRGASGAMGSLWMTYGEMVPLMAGFAVAAGTSKTITSGSEFDYTTRSIQKLSGEAYAGAEALSAIQQELLGLQGLVHTPNELAKGMLEFARAGIPAAQAAKDIAEVSKFSFLGEMDLDKTVETVVGLMSAFKEETATPALNQIAVVADRTSVSLQQMTEAFKNTTSLGTVMGLSLQDVAFSLGALGEAGIRGATAGAALNTMMYKLVAPTATTEKAMKALGVSFNAFDDVTGKIKPITQIADELAKMTRSLRPNETAKLFESMVGLRGVKALGALVAMAQEGSDKFKQLKLDIEAAAKAKPGEATTYLSKYYNLVSESGKVQLQILKAEFDKLFTANYDNSSVVAAIKELQGLIAKPETAALLSTITTSVINLVTFITSAVSQYPDMLEYGLVGALIWGKKGAAIGATFGVISDHLDRLKSSLDSLLGVQTPNKLAGPTSLFTAYNQMTDAWANLFTKRSADVVKAAQGAKKALGDIGGPDSNDKGNTASVQINELQKYEDLIDRIQNQVNTLKENPLEILRTEELKAISDLKLSLSGVTQTQEEYNERMKDGEKLITELFNLKRAEAFKKQIAKDLSELRKEWQSYADFIFKLQEKIAGNKSSLKDEIRKLDQSLLSGQSLWADKAKQIAETLAAAKKANEAGLGSLSIGNKTAAETSFAEADKQFEKYKSLQEEYYQAGINGERQTTLTRKQQVEAYKQILKDLYAYQETQMKKQQDIASTQQDILKGRAEDVAKGPVDMTEGMDAAKARWIDNWKAAHETTTQMASDSMDMIQTKIGTIRMPTEEWLTSIFTMKGVFIEAVDEMSRKVEAGGKVTGTGKIYTNAVPGKNPIVSNAQAEASAIMAALERARAENTRAAEQAAISAGKQQQAAIVEGSRQGAEVMKQGVAAGGVSAVKAVEVGKNVAANQGLTLGSDITISGIDKAQDRINELKRQIDNLALSKGWASTSEDADVFKEQIASILAELTSFQEKYGALQQQAQAGGIEEMLKVENAAEDVSSLTDRARDLAAAFNNVEVDDTFVTTLTEKIADLGNGTLEFHESWEKDWSDTEKKAKGAVSGIYEYLDELVSRDWTVDVKVREERALGGLIRGYQVGGLIQKLAAGGGVRNMLQGAYLSGYGGGDRRLILGEDGEFMIRKEMVRAAGRDVASDFNAGKWGRVVDKLSNRFQLYDAPRLTGYESGGYIQGGAASTDFSATSTQVIMNFDDTGETATMYGSSRDVDVFSRAMSRKARLRSA